MPRYSSRELINNRDWQFFKIFQDLVDHIIQYFWILSLFKSINIYLVKHFKITSCYTISSIPFWCDFPSCVVIKLDNSIEYKQYHLLQKSNTVFTIFDKLIGDINRHKKKTWMNNRNVHFNLSEIAVNVHLKHFMYL